ncbi:MAG: hypothetical protein R2754_15110 [Microthrixaceae bacterium]
MATRIERRLRANQEKLRQLHEDLGVVSEQLQAVNDVADDAEIRSLVSETPLAGAEADDAVRQRDALSRERDHIVSRIAKLEGEQDRLLEDLTERQDRR